MFADYGGVAQRRYCSTSILHFSHTQKNEASHCTVSPRCMLGSSNQPRDDECTAVPFSREKFGVLSCCCGRSEVRVRPSIGVTLIQSRGSGHASTRLKGDTFFLVATSFALLPSYLDISIRHSFTSTSDQRLVDIIGAWSTCQDQVHAANIGRPFECRQRSACCFVSLKPPVDASFATLHLQRTAILSATNNGSFERARIGY